MLSTERSARAMAVRIAHALVTGNELQREGLLRAAGTRIAEDLLRTLKRNGFGDRDTDSALLPALEPM